MAIHAKCTNPASYLKTKPLIYKDFIRKAYWHNHCNYLSMQAQMS